MSDKKQDTSTVTSRIFTEIYINLNQAFENVDNISKSIYLENRSESSIWLNLSILDLVSTIHLIEYLGPRF